MGRGSRVGVAMKQLRVLLVLLVGLGFADAAAAQQLPIPMFSGPMDPASMQSDLNGLISQINGVLVPALGPSSTMAGTPVNKVSLTGGLTGNPATIGLQPGADANASIQIKPNGSGNIVLAGALQFGIPGSFVATPTLVPCPGRHSGAAFYGINQTVQGVFLVKDWLGMTRGIPVC